MGVTGDLIVRPRHSAKFRLFLGALALVALLASWVGIYAYGLSRAGFNQLAALQREQALKAQIQTLHDESQQLREGLAHAQRARQMDQVAYQELDRSLKTSAEEIAKLREELNFYRNIISPAGKASGLQIQGFQLTQGAGSHEYRYKLVLIQALKHDRDVQGQVNLSVMGTRGGREAALDFPGAREKPIRVRFKYFQDIEGEFRLPPDFTPGEIKIIVSTNRGGPIEQTYPWEVTNTAGI